VQRPEGNQEKKGKEEEKIGTSKGGKLVVNDRGNSKKKKRQGTGECKKRNKQE